jgi:uncharacterized protein YndB with AHSA1/START domain
MAAKNSAAASPADRVLIITRVFDAPRDLVWRAFTELERMSQWWGMKGMTTRVHKLDFRPGGAFVYSQRTADGREMWGKWIYREIVAPERFVVENSVTDEHGNPVPPLFNPAWPLEMLTTATLTENRGRTTLAIWTTPLNATESQRRAFDDGLKFMETGFNATLDMLDEYLAERHPLSESEPASDREIVVTRVFDAPRALVFKAWTDPKHLGRWWGPNGFSITTHEMEFKPSGVWRFVMHGPDGRDYQNKVVYVEIAESERLIYRHVSGPQFQMTVTFADDGDKTMLTARMLFESAALRDKVIEEFGAIEGLKQTLGRLADFLPMV